MKQDFKYCAVYTRKSTEEGLDQEFNSLDAQREACLAYIASQKSEGWSAVKQEYDDGGFSGGNVERPALKRLMGDIQAGRVHIVVVYKIDRLTRSLMDFAKLVESFDKHGVTFVSVTQSFSTVTSMGRLTLNVLLSFAQFEREVTTERIRDKFAASKQKGIWMGGTLPTGYGVKNRQLYVKEDEAAFIRMLFEQCLRIGSVNQLQIDLERQGIKSPIKVRVNGEHFGGVTLSGGALRNLLTNPIYIGKIRHKDKIYEGQHKPIIPIELWQAIQDKIKYCAHTEKVKRRSFKEHKILQGKIFDIEGNKYSPVYSLKKGQRRYKYYLSVALRRYKKHPKGIIARIPATEIEDFVYKNLMKQVSDTKSLANILGINYEDHALALTNVAAHHEKLSHIASVVAKIIVDVDALTIEIKLSELCRYVEEILEVGLPLNTNDDLFKMVLPYHTRRSKKGTVVVRPGKADDKPHDIFDLPPIELKNLVRGIVWRSEHFKGKTIRQIADREKLSEGFVGRLIHYSVEFN